MHEQSDHKEHKIPLTLSAVIGQKRTLTGQTLEPLFIIQSDLSLGTEESGRRGEVAVMRKKGSNITFF